MQGRRGRHFGHGVVAKRWAVAAVCAALLGGAAAGAAASPGTATVGNDGSGFHTHSGPGGEQDVNACSDAVALGVAHCLAHKRVDADAENARPARPGARPFARPGAGAAGSDARPDGRLATLGNNGAYDPSYLQAAYNLAAAAASAGSQQTVAIVDAYDDPNASADLTSYRSFFGLTCPSGGNCLTKVDEHGGQNYPAGDSGWSQEISLDLDMVSAVCPNCKILLVEAASASFADLAQAANEAAALGANAISNSYGGSEFLGESSFDGAYDHPGVAVTVSSGDSGYGVEYPAASPYVTAVGGTSLYQTGTAGRVATETAWSGAGSGCSAYEPKPAWQTDAGCAKRAVADVSAVADPSTGVWVYDTYGTGGSWLIFGGTSVASPIVASVYALAGNSASANQLASYPYADTGGLNDVTSGSNGSCAGSYLCTAGPGYDGPTGLGTPNTPAPFAYSGAAPAPVAPSAPLGLAASPGNAKVSLTWAAPSSNGGSAVLHYNVYRGTTSGGEAMVTSVSGTSFSDAGVTNGTTYYYEVTAVNAIGESGLSNEASATPRVTATVPGAPSLTASSSATRGVALSWTVPSANGSAITSYTVYRGSFSGSLSRLTSIVCSSPTSCSYTDTSTRSGRTYYYQVAAVNGVGTGPRSNQASARAT